MSLETLKSALDAGGEHLGDLCWWTLADATVDRSTLEKTWIDAGLPAEFLPEPPTTERALKTATREALIGQSERLIRLGLESEAEIIYAVVHEHRHIDGSVSFTQEARITLDRRTKSFSSDAPSHELVLATKAAFERLLYTHTTDEVRRAVVRALHAFAAITLRDHGGVYWIPRTFSAQVRQLQSAVERLGSSKFYLVPVHDSADTNRSLGEAAQGALEDELAGLEKEIESFLSSPPERASTLVRRFDAFEELRTRAQLYRDILKVRVDDLDSRLDELGTVVEKLLVEKTAA